MNKELKCKAWDCFKEPVYCLEHSYDQEDELQKYKTQVEELKAFIKKRGHQYACPSTYTKSHSAKSLCECWIDKQLKQDSK